MTKIVVNRCWGVFGLSEEAYAELGLERNGHENAFRSDDDRVNPKLVEVIERLGSKASGSLSKLEVVEIPDDVEWVISERDGWEIVEEVHRSW